MLCWFGKISSQKQKAACQSFLLFIKHYAGALLLLIYPSSSRVLSLSLIASRNCQRSMQKRRSWPLQVLVNVIVGCVHFIFRCVKLRSFTNKNTVSNPTAICLPLSPGQRQAKLWKLKMLSTSFRVTSCWVTR